MGVLGGRGWGEISCGGSGGQGVGGNIMWGFIAEHLNSVRLMIAD